MNHNTRKLNSYSACLLSIAFLLAGCSILPGVDFSLSPTPTIRAAAGGFVVSADGGARLEIPPGALSADAAIRVDSLGLDELPAAWTFASRYLGAARFAPHGLQFAQPVTANFRLAHPQPPGKALELFYYLESEERYVYLGPRAIVDPDGTTATAQIDHFSTYAVAEPPPGGYPVLVVIRVTLSGSPVVSTGSGNPHVAVNALGQSVVAVDGGGGLYVAFLQTPDVLVVLSQVGDASADYTAPSSGDGGVTQYTGGTQWNADAWQVLPNPTAPISQVASAIAGQLGRVSTATQIAGAVRTVLGDATFSAGYLLIGAAAQIDLHSVDEIQGPLSELAEQLAQLLALRETLLANNCPFIPAQVQFAMNAALQAQQSENPQDIQNALHQIELAIAAIAQYLAHPFVAGVNPASARPGESVALTGLPAGHKCSGASLTITVASEAGNVAGQPPQLTIATPKRAGHYPVDITVRESILGIETQGSASVQVLNVAPVVVTSSNVTGLPGDAVLFRNRVVDDNAELDTEIIPMPLAGSALGALEDLQADFVPYAGGGILIVRGRIKDPQADGEFQLNAQFRDQAGLVSNTLPDGLTVQNVIPDLRSLSVSPQAIQPSAEIPTLLEVRARFTDRNGLGDIRRVTLNLQAVGVNVQVISQNPVSNPASNEVVFAFQATGTSGSVRVTVRVEDEGGFDSLEKVIPVVNLPPQVAISGCTSVPFEGLMIFGVQARDPNGDPLTAQFQAGGVTTPVAGTNAGNGWFNFIISMPAPPPGTNPLRFLITAGGHTISVECGSTAATLLPTATSTALPTPTATPAPTETPPQPTQPMPTPSHPAPLETTPPLPTEKP